jgi:hypothetical protein
MDWLRYSGIWISLVVNPFHWRFSFDNKPDTLLSAPNMRQCQIQIAFIAVRLVVDNGDW